jgi:hypothetical protein
VRQPTLRKISESYYADQGIDATQALDCERPINLMIFMAGATTNHLRVDGIPGGKRRSVTCTKRNYYKWKHFSFRTDRPNNFSQRKQIADEARR